MCTYYLPIKIVYPQKAIFCGYFFSVFFCIRLLSVLRDHRFFHPRHDGQWPPTSKDFYTRSYPLHYFLIFILEKEPVFPFSMLSARQGNYWYHFGWGLNPEPPALEASTLPLGYRGGGISLEWNTMYFHYTLIYITTSI